MIGVIEKVQFQRRPGGNAHSALYVVRRSNGGSLGRYFSAREEALVRFE